MSLNHTECGILRISARTVRAVFQRAIACMPRIGWNARRGCLRTREYR